jgi:hypothetical protein
MLNVVILSAVMRNVVMLSVVAPCFIQMSVGEVFLDQKTLNCVYASVVHGVFVGI